MSDSTIEDAGQVGEVHRPETAEEILHGLLARSLAKKLTGNGSTAIEFEDIGDLIARLHKAGVRYRTESTPFDFGRQKRQVIVIEWEVEVKS